MPRPSNPGRKTAGLVLPAPSEDSTIPGEGAQVESWGLDKLLSISQATTDATGYVLRE